MSLRNREVYLTSAGFRAELRRRGYRFDAVTTDSWIYNNLIPTTRSPLTGSKLVPEYVVGMLVDRFHDAERRGTTIDI